MPAFSLRFPTIANTACLSLRKLYCKLSLLLPRIFSLTLQLGAAMKPSLVTFLLVCLVLTSSFFEVTMAGSALCDDKCGERCSKAGVQDRCLKYCGICCEKCQCVPSGTYGNKHECPCYRDMKNSKGKPKCP